MYFDEPAGTVTGKSEWSHGALLTASAVVLSPLGYLLTTWLGKLADGAAAALFHAG
jgi:NADH-quinone oxidoreductase subunit N